MRPPFLCSSNQEPCRMFLHCTVLPQTQTMPLTPQAHGRDDAVTQGLHLHGRTFRR
jgi:hypothetical protein